MMEYSVSRCFGCAISWLETQVHASIAGRKIVLDVASPTVAARMVFKFIFFRSLSRLDLLSFESRVVPGTFSVASEPLAYIGVEWWFVGR